MSYKNSVKLLTSNFSLVWKQLLYMLVVCLFVLGVSYAIALPIINTLRAEGVIAEISKVFESIYTAPKEVLTDVTNATNHLFDVLSGNFSRLFPSYFGLVFMLFFVFQVLKNMSMFNISNVMFMKMTSFTTIGYTRTYISCIWQSLRYALVKFVLSIPFVVLKFLTIYTFIKTVTTPLSIFLGLFAVVLVFVVLSSIELTIFTSMAPTMLEKNSLAFKAFFKSEKPVFKRFGRIFSNAVIVVLTLVLVNVLLGLFTIGVALIITLPASMVFVSIFQLCAHFNAKGERYYISRTVIVTPLGEENSIEK